MDQVHVVRHKVLVEGRGIRAVAREMGISRNTVRRYLGVSEPVRVEKGPRGRPVGDKVLPRVEQILAESPRWTGGKQRLTATRLHEMLRGEGYEVGATLVKEAVAEWKGRRREVFVPLVYRPGELAEVDFFEVLVDVLGERTKAQLFVMRLMHSGRDFAWLYERQDQVSFLDGHVRAFAHFGAVPQRIAYDNLKSAVRRMLVGSEREMTERFTALVSHYLFEPCFCRPATGHDKGGVEARGKAIRWQQLVPIPAGESLLVVNERLLARLDERQGQVRSDGDGRTIGERFAEERGAMLPLPECSFRARRTHHVEVSSRSLVTVEGAVYSVPCEWVGHTIVAHVGATHVELVSPRREGAGRIVVVPTLSFRGLDNETYYLLAADRARYADYTGTGNTLNANDAVVRRMILDSLRYWVAHMHVDGFRFDLASVLSRDESGRPLQRPPVLWDIQSDPVLAGTKLIAEAWDAAGLYQVGSFPGDTWQEWNGKFRDDVRRFVKSDNDTVTAFAYRCFGSPDLYAHQKRGPEQSINFVTCHDGFTLNDLVSYDQKHNQANGENGCDGSDANLSWNCGVEGPTADPEIERLRHRQVKNFLSITLLSLGTPMVLMGDEVRRTQRGNNSAYCQDNEISWFDWTLLERYADLHRFVKTLIRQRLMLGDMLGLAGLSLTEILHRAQIQPHGARLNQPDLSGVSHSLALTVRGEELALFHFMFNAYWEPLVFELPRLTRSEHECWRRWIDTYRDAPDDILEEPSAPRVEGPSYTVQARSFVVLVALRNGRSSPRPRKKRLAAPEQAR